MSNSTTQTGQRWLTAGVRGIGAASFLADVGHEIPTALLPNLLTATLGAPAALGLIEGIADGLAGGAIADDPQRRHGRLAGRRAASWRRRQRLRLAAPGPTTGSGPTFR
jgi:hypothetical protein